MAKEILYESINAISAAIFIVSIGLKIDFIGTLDSSIVELVMIIGLLTTHSGAYIGAILPVYLVKRQ